jgi:CRP-like cAMP-binding protein
MVDVESALERALSVGVIDRRPPMRRLRPGQLLTEQGRRDDTLYLLFDGMLRVEIDGDPVAVVGPGAILGEQALLNDGTRSATLRALTPCRVAVVDRRDVDLEALRRIARDRTTDRTPV